MSEKEVTLDKLYADNPQVIGREQVAIYVPIDDIVKALQPIYIKTIEQSVSNEDSGINTIKITLTNNEVFEFEVKNGSKGKQGDPGEQGPQGEPFFISKIFKSVDEMNRSWETDGVPFGRYVAIDTDVENDEAAQVYIKTEQGYKFVTDLSGKQGIEGPPVEVEPIINELKQYIDDAFLSKKW